MKIKRIIILFITLLCFLNFSNNVYAIQSIILDGKFQDWIDKPGIVDESGDEASWNDIVEVKWFPDSYNVYFYVSRRSGSTNYYFNQVLKIDNKTFYLDVAYYGNKGIVYCTLKDQNGSLIWADSGIWADKRNKAKEIEYYIPISQLATTTAGYELETEIFSGNDKVPSNGTILISTISTLGKWLTMILVAIVLLVVSKQNMLVRG